MPLSAGLARINTAAAHSSQTIDHQHPVRRISQPTQQPSQRRQPLPRQQPSQRQAAAAAQRGFNVLIDHYLNMLPAPPTAMYEEPKGAAKLFVDLLCPPVSFSALKPYATNACAQLSHITVNLSVVLVPLWLWLLRHLSRQDSPLYLSVLVVLVGLAVLLISELVHQADLQRKLKRGSVVITPTQLGVWARPPPPLDTAPARATAPAQTSKTSRPPLPPANATAAPTTAVAVPSSVATRAARPAAQPAPASSAPQRQKAAADEALARAVRGAIMRLEQTVYGNEVSADVLPASALPQHTQRLCEEVGVAWDQGQASKLDYLAQQLQAVQRMLGLQ